MSYKQRARLSRDDRGLGFCFLRRAESLRSRSMRRCCWPFDGSEGLRRSGRFLIFSVNIRLVESGEWARERSKMVASLSLGAMIESSGDVMRGGGGRMET